MEKPSYYSILTADVRYDERLKANEKIMFSEISALTQATGLCWASNNYFAELYKVDKSTISRWINHLIELDYLEVRYTYKEGTKEIEKRMLKIKSIGIDEIINTPLIKKSTPPTQNNQRGIDEKVKGNTTRVNTTSNNNIYTDSPIDVEQDLQNKTDITQKMLMMINEYYGFDYKSNQKSQLFGLVSSGVTLEQMRDVLNYVVNERDEYKFYPKLKTLATLSKFDEYYDDARAMGYINGNVPSKNNPKKQERFYE